MSKIVAVSGFKNAGKTTLIVKLVAALSEMGYKVATVKHDGHDFEVDIDETDTAQHRKAGAVGTAIFSETKCMIIKQVHIDEKQLCQEFDYADIILLEGFKYSEYPKIEIVKEDEEPIGKNVIAYVSEVEREGYYSRDNIEAILNVLKSVLEL